MLIRIACLLAVVMVFLIHQNLNKGARCIMFSENLKTLRKQKGFSQEELASRLHVVRQTISKWEKNLSVPDADTLIRLAEILEVSVSELLGSKIETENGNITNDVAEQLSRINEQLAIKNRRSRRILKAIVIILTAIFLLSIFIIMFLSVPDLNNSTHNNQPIVNVETIQVDD
jgi:transcriptional regulator with XRE-family HTH domain